LVPVSSASGQVLAKSANPTRCMADRMATKGKGEVSSVDVSAGATAARAIETDARRRSMVASLGPW